MQHIHSKDTKIEVVLRKALWAKGYRYRKNWSELPGKPDIVLIKYKIAIFCDSEFFHGKDWEVLKPRLEKGNNPDYWIPKITRNMETDKKLLFLGWTVLHFWGERYIEASGRVYTGCRRNNFGTKNRVGCLLMHLKNLFQSQLCIGCLWLIKIYPDEIKYYHHQIQTLSIICKSTFFRKRLFQVS